MPLLAYVFCWVAAIVFAAAHLLVPAGLAVLGCALIWVGMHKRNADRAGGPAGDLVS